MPRKKSHRHRLDPQEADGDADGDHEDGVANGSSVDDLFEQMLEQRYTTREAALKQLAKTLSQTYSFDLIDNSRTTIAEGFKKSFKKGRESEQQLAAQALSLVILTLGADSEDLFGEFQPLLLTWLKNYEEGASSVLNEAVTTLAILYFVSCTDELATREYITLLETIFESNLTALHTNAVRAWTLLLTTIPSNYIISKIFPKNIQTLYALLESKDVETRMAVGEGIAFLLDVMRQSVEEREDSFDLHKYDNFVNTDDLLEKIKEFSFSTNRQTAKKERTKQKGFFKNIMHSIEDGQVPEETLVICDQKITFDGWRHHVQLNFMRECLAEGTQQHLEHNSLLQDIFEFQLDTETGKPIMSKIEKRLFMSPNSAACKARTKTRSQERSAFGRSGGL